MEPGADGTRAERDATWRVIVPADGTCAATCTKRDFGTSPIYGQLTGKPLLAFVYSDGGPDMKHNRDRELNR
jgi:hypothetical protein